MSATDCRMYTIQDNTPCLLLPTLYQRGQAGTIRTRASVSERGSRESDKISKPLPVVNELQAVKVRVCLFQLNKHSVGDFSTYVQHFFNI